jgi:hypothetical protein
MSPLPCAPERCSYRGAAHFTLLPVPHGQGFT